jgi:hypothetical protein
VNLSTGNDAAKAFTEALRYSSSLHTIEPSSENYIGRVLYLGVNVFGPAGGIAIVGDALKFRQLSQSQKLKSQKSSVSS